MKKLFAAILMLALLVWPGTACAADVKVSLDGKPQSGAFVQDEQLYMPLRPVLDALGLASEWDGKEQRISVAMPDGSWLHMYIGQESSMRVWPDGQSCECIFGGAPQMRRGSACISLQNADSLLGVGVDYLAADEARLYTDRLVYNAWPELNRDTYILDLKTGALTCRQSGQNEERLIAALQLPADAGDERHMAAMRTTAGNYYMTYRVSAAKSNRNLCYAQYFIDGQSGQSYQTFLRASRDGRSAAPDVLWEKEALWLNGDSELYYVQDTSPVQATRYDLAAMQAAALGGTEPAKPVYCYWAQAGQYLLLGDYRDFVLYDLQKERGQLLTERLLTAEVRARAEELLLKIAPEVYSQPEEMAAFWQRLGPGNALPLRTTHPCLTFSVYDGGMLHFSLELIYYVPNSENYAIHNVSSQIALNELI